MMLFLAFSANVRNLLLAADDLVFTRNIFIFRLLAILPLSAGVVLLSGGIVEIAPVVIVAVVLRRCSEWIAELQITERECAEDFGFVWRFISIQISIVGLLFISIPVGNELFTEALLVVWAISPLGQVVPFLRRLFTLTNNFSFDSTSMLPHVGSSMVVGIAIYVMRLMIVSLVGKASAGILFAAYAIGGILVSFYVYAVGPALIRWDMTAGRSRIMHVGLVVVMFVIGALLVVVAAFISDHYYHSLLLASGISVVGGGVMVAAQKRRLSIILANGKDVYVADALANIALICSIPFVYYLLGRESLSYVYLLSSLLSVFAYIVLLADGYGGGRVANIRAIIGEYAGKWIAVAIMLPVFFQFNGSIFSAQDMVYDSGGRLLDVPLPVSVIAACLGFVFLVKPERTVSAINYIFFSFSLMLFSTLMVVMREGEVVGIGKMILQIQFIIPMFALMLGLSLVDATSNRWGEYIIERGCLYVVSIVVPLQLLATLIQGRWPLTPYMYLFSIYQHLQYVSVIMVGVFWWASITCFERHIERGISMLLAPFIGIYAAAALSVQTAVMVLVGAAALLLMRGFKWRATVISFLVLLGLVLGIVGDYRSSNMDVEMDSSYIEYMSWEDRLLASKNGLEAGGVVAGVDVLLESRLYVWDYYWEGIAEDYETFLFGHVDRPDRYHIPSAQNYILDLMYNYGLLSVIPFIVFIGVTVKKIVTVLRSRSMSVDLLALSGLVSLFVVGVNFLTVGLRQPYAGICMFFLWGLLLARLDVSCLRTEKY